MKSNKILAVLYAVAKIAFMTARIIAYLSYLNVTIHDLHNSDWLGKAFALSSIGYTSTRKTVVCHSDLLVSYIKIKRIDF